MINCLFYAPSFFNKRIYPATTEDRALQYRNTSICGYWVEYIIRMLAFGDNAGQYDSHLVNFLLKILPLSMNVGDKEHYLRTHY